MKRFKITKLFYVTVSSVYRKYLIQLSLASATQRAVTHDDDDGNLDYKQIVLV